MTAVSDEGMWLLNDPPRELLKQKYDFDLTDAWLDRAMRASIRFNNGGSGGFVSPNGLLVTNHHVAADSLQKLSKDKDLYSNGFHAATRSDELKCPDLELNVLQEIIDVTKEVQAAVKPDMKPAEAFAARRASWRRSRRSRSTRPACVPTSSRSITAACITCTATRNTPTCASSSAPRSHRLLRRRRRQLRVPAQQPRHLLLSRLRERQTRQDAGLLQVQRNRTEGRRSRLRHRPPRHDPAARNIGAPQTPPRPDPSLHPLSPADARSGHYSQYSEQSPRKSARPRPTCTAPPTPARPIAGNSRGCSTQR